MKKNNEDFPIVIETFNKISDCFEFYNTQIKNATSMKDEGCYTDKEFKKVKIYLMKQMWANLKLLGVKDKTARQKTKELLNSLKELETSIEEENSSAEKESSSEEETQNIEQSQSLPQGQEVKAIEDCKVSVEDKEQTNEDKNTDDQ